MDAGRDGGREGEKGLEEEEVEEKGGAGEGEGSRTKKTTRSRRGRIARR